VARVATTERVRPLRLAELLDAALKLYARNWRVLCACVAGIVLPLQILSVVALLALAPDQLDPATADTSIAATTDDPALLAAEFAIAALQGLTFLLVAGACFKALTDARAGVEPTARGSLAFFRPRLAALLGLFVLYTLGVTLGAFAFFFPGVWLAIAWSLAVPALMAERLGATQALTRSFRLVQGRWWSVFGTLLLGVLLVAIVSTVVEGLLVSPALVSDGSDAVAAAATVFAGTIGGILTAPFTAAVVTLVYFDQRVRKEGAEPPATFAGEPAPAPLDPFGRPVEPAAGTRWLPPEPPAPPSAGP
jgi:Membrane domain of glycerophosphoryl diester phosphodiesterase